MGDASRQLTYRFHLLRLLQLSFLGGKGLQVGETSVALAHDAGELPQDLDMPVIAGLRFGAVHRQCAGNKWYVHDGLNAWPQQGCIVAAGLHLFRRTTVAGLARTQGLGDGPRQIALFGFVADAMP
jgi:hypothetical protein